MATTAPKDQGIETYARELSERNSANGKFLVYVYGWGDIEGKLNDYQGILQKYYQRLVGSKASSDIYFNFWYKEANIEKLFYYACTLPFGSYDIRYSSIYISVLVGYLNKHDTFLTNINETSTDEVLKRFVQLFNDAARSLIGLINEYSPKEDILQGNGEIICKYWVDCSHLDYYDKGDFIEGKKNQVRQSFYTLIQVSNKITLIWNTQLNTAQRISLTEFLWLNPNFPLLGGNFLSEPHYPMLEN